MRRERRDDDPLVGVREHVVEHRADLGLGRHEARHLGVGGVHHEEVHALLAEAGEGAQVGDAAVERQLVHLEVTGVQHGAGGGGDRHGERVRDGVVDRDELAVEDAELLALPFLHLEGVGLDAVLLELRLDERERQARADQRDVLAQPQQVRHGTDVVLVPVRQHDRLDVVEAVLDVVEVRQDQVHAGLVVLGEQHAAVDDEQLSGMLQDRHVASHLAQAAEGDHPQSAVRQRGGQGQFGVRMTHVASKASFQQRKSNESDGGVALRELARPRRCMGSRRRAGLGQDRTQGGHLVVARGDVRQAQEAVVRDADAPRPRPWP